MKRKRRRMKSRWRRKIRTRIRIRRRRKRRRRRIDKVIFLSSFTYMCLWIKINLLFILFF